MTNNLSFKTEYLYFQFDRNNVFTAAGVPSAFVIDNGDRLFDQAGRIRCASMVVQAISASASVLKGEPPIFIAHRL